MREIELELFRLEISRSIRNKSILGFKTTKNIRDEFIGSLEDLFKELQKMNRCISLPVNSFGNKF